MSNQQATHYQYPTHARAVGLARRDCRKALRQWGIPLNQEPVNNVVTLVSELMTNAVTHGRVWGRLVAFTVEHEDGTVRASVRDARGEKEVTPLTAGPDDENGRGLRLVRELSDNWGVKPEVVGKTVWIEVKLAEGPACTS